MIVRGFETVSDSEHDWLRIHTDFVSCTGIGLTVFHWAILVLVEQDIVHRSLGPLDTRLRIIVDQCLSLDEDCSSADDDFAVEVSWSRLLTAHWLVTLSVRLLVTELVDHLGRRCPTVSLGRRRPDGRLFRLSTHRQTPNIAGHRRSCSTGPICWSLLSLSVRVCRGISCRSVSLSCRALTSESAESGTGYYVGTGFSALKVIECSDEGTLRMFLLLL